MNINSCEYKCIVLYLAKEAFLYWNTGDFPLGRSKPLSCVPKFSK